MPVKLTVTSEDIRDYLVGEFGVNVKTPELQNACDHFGLAYQTVSKYLNDFKVKRGVWDLTVAETKKALEKTYTQTQTQIVDSFDPSYQAAKDLKPKKDDNFVPFGNFTDLKKVITSKIFYPIFITGLSGNGKTFGVEQACAQAKRDLIRVNITVETDEDDLIGGFRLVDGSTVWHNGPVIEALQRGAVLLLDELDLASNKILCLQSILEGKGVYLKKIGKQVTPAPGFTVVATANTKGKGSEDGRFIGTNVLNEAFLERFPITFEQEYPKAQTEVRMLNNYCKELDCCDDKYIANLTAWAEIIRKTFNDGGVDEVISTRRLVHIIRAYAIFSDRVKAIQVCLNRFDDETKRSFLELYDKIDNEVDIENLDNILAN
jgi:MoxR-like ATPase